MATHRRSRISIYVDRNSQRWIVRDPEGNLWILPVVEQPWDHRQPLPATDEIVLEPVPGHYKYLLNLPF